MLLTCTTYTGSVSSTDTVLCKSYRHLVKNASLEVLPMFTMDDTRSDFSIYCYDKHWLW